MVRVGFGPTTYSLTVSIICTLKEVEYINSSLKLKKETKTICPQTPFVDKEDPIVPLYTPRMEGVTVYSGVLFCSEAKGQYKMLSRNSFHRAKKYETASQRVVRSNYREAVIEWFVVCILKLKH